jgi:hypothetical protein
MFNISVPADIALKTEEYIPTGKNWTLDELCTQFNYTKFDDEDEEEYTPLNKCRSTQKPLDFVYIK